MRLATLLAALTLGVPPAPPRPEGPPAERPADSRIVAATIFPGQALVTREVAVPEGGGTIELVVGPLPEAAVAASVAAEGLDGARVLGARHRAREVSAGTEAEIRRLDAEVRQLALDAQSVQAEVAVQLEDQRLLRGLGDLNGRTTRNMAESGRFEDLGAINLARFIMATAAERSRAEVERRRRLQGLAEAGEAARRELDALKARATRTVREAVVTVRKDRPGAAAIRLQYLVERVDWAPQYRIRAGLDDAPAGFEALAAVRQESGEDWSGVALALATASPATDAAPPDLAPLRMTPADASAPPPRRAESHDERSGRVRALLERAVPMRFPQDTPLAEVVKYLRQATQGPAFPNGVPIYVDREGLQEVDRTEASPVSIDLADVPLRASLRLLLRQLGLTYVIQDGVLTITNADEGDDGQPPAGVAMMGGMGGGMGGMGGMMGGGAIEQSRAARSILNQAAARGQAGEFQVGDDDGPDRVAPDGGDAERAGPSVTLRVEGTVDLPSRPAPLLIEVGRADLPAEHFARATPVLTPRVYRMARLTNSGSVPILPGEATVYRGEEFVGRMALPLVAAGESFVVGFGVDPQLQVSRRLASKTRTIQGGNQVLAYGFRLHVRNYRDRPVRVQLLDRLPLPDGEAAAVHLGRVSRELSQDPLYLRTARADNLLRWDLDVPAGTVGDRPLSVEYDFRIEQAKDLPPPRFQAGGLKEGPIGGPAAQGGMGGMGGGFRSVPLPPAGRD